MSERRERTTDHFSLPDPRAISGPQLFIDEKISHVFRQVKRVQKESRKE
jgi:hypothetical protein